MDEFDTVVSKIRYELACRGMEHSSLLYDRIAQAFTSRYYTCNGDQKELLLTRLKQLEKTIGPLKPFDWEGAFEAYHSQGR